MEIMTLLQGRQAAFNGGPLDNKRSFMLRFGCNDFQSGIGLVGGYKKLLFIKFATI
ncbi:putative AlgH/UPF0301 family transcriptional regulator [Phyllobacterium ifriqiyense]|uniref:AlgH/UPF0301 family transcriptional regulator n=1 Tax=Phyllobacterium ifriqiyense TaxID=314238 RepID=A0ABU0S544_9HYPH|nr:putative AlgH/UPF0301 family transcriptional regulator [Phyllobacterium ifriqiyense]